MNPETSGLQYAVYVVDDDPSVRKALRRMFESLDYQVETFGTARQFLDFERSDGPGCLILDVEMPGQSGLELQEELVAHQVDLPIVFMTAHGDIPMTVQAMRSGAVDFLPKPVDGEVLLRTSSNRLSVTQNPHAVEMFYRFQLNPWLSFTPDVQYIRPTLSGLTGGSDAFVYGLRMNMKL